MGTNIELWQYRLYQNGALYLDEIFTNNRLPKANKAEINSESTSPINRETFTLEHHLCNKDETIKRWFEELKEFTQG
jgi:hypothetical protein